MTMIMSDFSKLTISKDLDIADIKNECSCGKSLNSNYTLTETRCMDFFCLEKQLKRVKKLQRRLVQEGISIKEDLIPKNYPIQIFSEDFIIDLIQKEGKKALTEITTLVTFQFNSLFDLLETIGILENDQHFLLYLCRKYPQKDLFKNFLTTIDFECINELYKMYLDEVIENQSFEKEDLFIVKAVNLCKELIEYREYILVALDTIEHTMLKNKETLLVFSIGVDLKQLKMNQSNLHIITTDVLTSYVDKVIIPKEYILESYLLSITDYVKRLGLTLEYL